MNRIDVLLHAADAGDTFLSWTWLRPPYAAQVSRRPAGALDDVLADLDGGLLAAALRDGGEADPATAPGDSTAPPAGNPLTSGPFSTRGDERELAERLASAALPAELATQLVDEARRAHIRLRITPSPRLARVPWELLLMPDGRRLIEVCEIVLDPPTAIYADRNIQPDPWATVADRPVLHVIDPLLSDRREQVLTPTGVRAFADRLASLRAAGRALRNGNPQKNPQSNVTREQLNYALRIRRSRLLYFGHVSARPEEPGTASIHLSDPAHGAWGMMPPRAGNRPLSALDLLLGTARCDDPAVWHRYDADECQLGPEIWPMPSRVALIACEGGVDFRSTETFGLVIAMLNAGAGLVTTTRWPLPSDAAFHAVGIGETALPTTELALHVDAAHDRDDPVAELRAWQLDQLQRWQRSADDVVYSPILWAALTHTWAPGRDLG